MTRSCSRGGDVARAQLYRTIGAREQKGFVRILERIIAQAGQMSRSPDGA